MSLEIRRRKRDWVGFELLEVVDTEPQTLAHVGFQVVASAMGAVLRKAFTDHLATCPSCMIPERAIDQCPEGIRLFYLQPEGDAIVIG